MTVSRLSTVLFLATVLPLTAIAGLADVTGSWSVSSNYRGRTAAIFSVNADGSVRTVLPMIPDDSPMHLMHGGMMVETKDGIVFRGAPGVFEQYAAGLAGTPAGKAFKKIAKEGVPLKVEGTGASRKLVPVVDPALKDWFTGGNAMAEDDVAKALKDREKQRSEMESYQWTVNEVKPCANADVTSNTLSSGSEKMLSKLFKPGSTFRFRRNDKDPSKNSVEFSAAPSAKTAYYASHSEKSIGVVWFNGSTPEQIKLMDQGLADSTKVGVHSFQADVGGKCMEIVAGQDRGGGNGGGKSGDSKDTKSAG